MKIQFDLTRKRIAAVVAGLLLFGLGGALAVSLSGLVSIAASSGHLAPWRWYLGWTLENAVRTQSALVEMPEGLDLENPALISRAAGHYATGCAGCHGAPGVAQSPVVLAMTPAPPQLGSAVSEWKPEELFWIVKHGIKYSGMPAWPARSRDDEVWAMVAFLRALPGMTPVTYGKLALGKAADAAPSVGSQGVAALNEITATALADCTRCHGADGLGRGEDAGAGAFPVIAGQPAAYLAATLRAFHSGARKSGFMQPAAARYDPAVLDRLARHFAALPAPAPTAPEVTGPRPERPAAGQDRAGLLEADTEAAPMSRADLLQLGRRLAIRGQPERKIPACDSCHARPASPPARAYPYLAGQPEWYLERHLRLWRQGTRGGTAYSEVMRIIAEKMTDSQIRAAAAWYAGQARPAQPK